MALQKLDFRPGVVLDDTEYAAGGYAISSQWVRWWLGKLSPLGGYRTKLSGIAGVARTIHEWAAIDGTLLAAIGTHTKLYVVRGSRLIDITPERSGSTLTSNPFAVTNLSPIVTVTLNGHGAATGDTVYIRGATAVGGLLLGGQSAVLGASPFTTINGQTGVQVSHTAHGLVDNDRVYFSSVTTVAGIPATDFTVSGGLRVQVVSANAYYVWVATPANASTTGGGTPSVKYAKPYVVTVTGPNTFTVNAGANANATASGGGSAAAYSFDLPIGHASAAYSAAGYGRGAYGRGAYGRSTALSDQPVRPRIWALDHAGEDLIANVSGGAIYHWSPQNLSGRAEVLTNSPARCLWVLVTPAREVMALGCTTTDGDFDPLCWRHTHPQEITTWTPAVTNSAAEDRVQAGSKFVGGKVTSQGLLVWTDTSVYAPAEVGAFDQTYRFDLLGAPFGLAGPNAVVECDGSVYWIDPSLLVIEFSGGTPQALLFPAREWMDTRVNKDQIEKICGFGDPKYPAASWLLPADGPECNTYLRFDAREAGNDRLAGWSTGQVARSVWCGDKLWPYPLAVSPGGTLYEQEVGFSADGLPIPWHIEWAPLEAGDGDYTLQVSRYVPDARREEDIYLTLTGRNWPSSQETYVRGPRAISPTTAYVDIPLKNTQIGIRLHGEMTQRWRMGLPRWDIGESTKKGGTA